MTRRPRTVLASTLAALTLLPMGAMARQDALYRTPTGVTELSGSKDPAAIPDYVAWRAAFRLLANRSHQEGETPLDKLMLPFTSEAERALIVKVAQRSAKAEEDNRARQNAAIAAFNQTVERTKEAYAKVNDEVFAIDYEQRVSTLSERDALLLRLSDETRMTLETVVEKVRRSVSLTVATSELERFRLPS